MYLIGYGEHLQMSDATLRGVRVIVGMNMIKRRDVLTCTCESDVFFPGGGVAEEETTPTAAETLRTQLYHSVLPLLSNNWVLLVIGAFLLVTLTGEPNVFKTIYLVFFFVFLITYQVS